MPSFGSLAPGQDSENDLIDWYRMNQPFGDISPPPDPVIGTLGKGTPYERPITQSDVDKAISLGLMSSGGGIGAAEGLMARARVPILKYAAGRRERRSSWPPLGARMLPRYNPYVGIPYDRDEPGMPVGTIGIRG